MAAQREWFEKDYYAVLGVPRASTRQGARARLQEAGEAVPPRREPGQQGRGGALQGDLGRVRRARRQRQAQGVRRGPAHGRVRRRSAWRLRSGRSGRLRRRPDVPLRDRRRRRLLLRPARRHVRRRRRRRPARRAVAARRVRSAARTSRPSCTSRSTTRCSGVTSTVRFRSDAVCHTCHGNGAAPGTITGDVPAVPRHGLDRGRPGSVLVLAGVPDVRRARPGHPDAVPDVSRPGRRGARPRGEGARSRPASPTGSASA